VPRQADRCLPKVQLQIPCRYSTSVECDKQENAACLLRRVRRRQHPLPSHHRPTPSMFFGFVARSSGPSLLLPRIPAASTTRTAGRTLDGLKLLARCPVPQRRNFTRRFRLSCTQLGSVGVTRAKRPADNPAGPADQRTQRAQRAQQTRVQQTVYLESPLVRARQTAGLPGGGSSFLGTFLGKADSWTRRVPGRANNKLASG